MLRQSAALIFLTGLTLSAPAFAQTNLPPEARARILIIDIDNALARKDEAGALAKLRELDGAGVARPNALFITEAKLAARAKDYPRAKAALDKYFKSTTPTDKSYDEAVQVYAALHRIEADAKAQEEAIDAAAWRSAQEQRNCAGYLTYLTAPSIYKRSVDAAFAAMEQAKCPSPATETLPPVSRAAWLQRTKNAEREAALAASKAFEQRVVALGAQGKWSVSQTKCNGTWAGDWGKLATQAGVLGWDSPGFQRQTYFITAVDGPTITVREENGSAEQKWAIKSNTIEKTWHDRIEGVRTVKYVRCRE